MSFESLGVVDRLIVERFDRLVEKYYSTTNEEELDTVAFGICEEIKELRQVLTNLDKKYDEMKTNGTLAASMSQKRGHELKRLQREVSELKRQLSLRSNVRS